MDQNAPKIVVPPPGPEALKWVQRDSKLMAPYNRPYYYPVVIAGGEGSVVEDVDGNKYIDWNSGLGVLSVGQSNPRIVKAITEKAKKFLHYSYTDFRYREAVLLGERLNKIMPMQCKYFFASGGTEANEAALKIAKHSSKNQLFIGFIDSFHGRTFGTMSFSSKSPVQRQGFHPLMPGVVLVPYPYCYRCPFNLEYPKCGIQCLNYVEERMFTTYCPPDEVAAVIVEPVFGDMGWVFPPDEYFHQLKELCDTHGILFISDEVQTGFGRTGKWCAMNHLGIEPDIVCLGKPIASGIPLSAMVARSDLILPTIRGGEDLFQQSFTLEANALGCAAALATIKVIEQQNLLENSTKLGTHLMKRLEELKVNSEIIGDVRGRGLLDTVEIVRDRKTKEPAPNESRLICKNALENGLYTMFMGAFSATSIRIAPPLNSTIEIVDLGLDILEKAIKQTEHELNRS